MKTMEKYVTVFAPKENQSVFEYALPKSLELNDCCDWFVAIIEFNHNEVLGSYKSLYDDSIVFVDEHVRDDPYTFIEFTNLILRTASNFRLYDPEYTQHYKIDFENLITDVKEKYQSDTDSEDVKKITVSSVITGINEYQQIYNNTPKPETFTFQINKKYTLIQLFYSFLGQLLAYFDSLKGKEKMNDEAKLSSLQNLLKIGIKSFRKEKNAYLKTNPPEPNDVYLTIKTDFTEPVIVGNCYDSFLYTCNSKMSENYLIRRLTYVKVTKKFINRMKFEICDLDRSPIVFRYKGLYTTCIKLHFTNKKYLNVNDPSSQTVD